MENPAEVLARLRELVGSSAVLLPLPLGKKGPDWPDWQKTTLEDTGRPDYVRRLEAAIRRGGNIGALLGPASNHLVTVDIDRDEEVEPFLDLNPKLRDTLRTRGARGCQIWFRVNGPYPQCCQKIKNKAGIVVAEWRGGGCQSVLWGKHPRGHFYRIDHEQPIIRF